MEYLPLDQQSPSTVPLDEEFGTPVEEAGPERPQNADEIFTATGLEDVSTTEAKSQVAQSQPDLIQNIIDDAFLTQEMQAEKIELQAQNQAAKRDDFLGNPDFYYEQAVAMRDPDVSEVDVRAAVNSRIEREVIAQLKAAETSEGGWGDAVLDFGAMMIREGTVGIVESFGDRTEDRGTLILANRLRMAPTEYRDWFISYAQEAREESLRNNNSWQISQLEDEVNSNGFDGDAGIKKAFALVDLLGLAKGATTSLRMAGAAARTTTTTGRVAALEGVEAASEAAARTTRTRVDAEVMADAGPGALNPHVQPVGLSEDWYTRAWKRSSLAQRVDDIYQSGALGRVVPDEVVQAQRARLTGEFEARVGAPTVRTVIESLPLGRYKAVADFGNPNTGLPFKPLANGEAPQGAKDLAAKHGGDLVPSNPSKPEDGFVVRMKENIDTTEFIGEIDPDELLAMERGTVRKMGELVFGNSWTGSTAARGVEHLTTLAQMSEAGSGAIGREFSEVAKTIGKVSQTERANLNTIVGRLRDDPEEAARRSWYSPEEFASIYKTMFGKEPTQKVREAYDAVVDISDAAAIIKANNLMGRYLKLDYRALEFGDGIRAPGKQIDLSKVDPKARVFDGEYGTVLRASDLGDELAVWKLDKPQLDGIEYVVKPKNVKELDPVDVMGYNAGGSRLNPHANYFVTLGGKRLKSLLSTFSEKQARLALEQIDTLRAAFKSGNLTDELIQANNKWNPFINSVEELDNFMKAHKWDLGSDGKLGYKQRNDKTDLSEMNGDEASSGVTMGEYIDNDMRRMDTVLPEFGGNKSFNIDPVSSVGQSFNSAVSEYATHAYTHNAMVGWVKEAQRRGRNWFPDPRVVSPNDHRNMFLKAEITGTDEFANRMREIRDIELRRMGNKGPSAQAMERLGGRLSEFIFDKTGKKTKLGDPSNALLNVGFQSAFGFFNASQILVQSSHAMTIIAASPKSGFVGASMAIALRGIYHTTPEAIEEAAKRAAKHYNMTPDEVKEIMEYVRTSGRNEIGGDAAEQGTGVAYGISGFGGESYTPSTLQKAWGQTKKTVGKGLDVGLTPFNAGERLARKTGIYTAILEFKAKNPGVSILSDRGRKWITRREQDLTFNMTTGSRPFIQSGAMRVPTQWLSHTFRAMETIFVGRNFTKAERARMAAVMVPFYGLSGFGLQNAASHVADKVTGGETDVDSPWFTALKWGVIDGITDALLPDEVGKEGTGLAPRLTPLGAIIETYRLITEGSLMEAVGGPSGGISKGIFDATAGALGDLYYGRDVLLTEDVIKIIRQPSGVDNVFKAMGIFNNGVYRSKNGVTIPGEMSPSEGILALFGVGSLKQTEWYAASSQMFRSSRSFSQYRSEINREVEVAFDLLQDDETKDRGLEMIRELNLKVTLSGYAPQQITSLRRSLMTRLPDRGQQVMDFLMETERRTDQQRLGKVLGAFD